MPDVLEKKLSANKTIEKKARDSPTATATKKDALLADARASGELPPVSKSPKASAPIVKAPVGHKVSEKGPSDSDDIIDIDETSYDVPHPTGDSKRDKVRKLLTEAFLQHKESFVSATEVARVANAVEEAMRNKYNGTGPDYRTKYRDLSFNFKDAKNGKLRRAVLTRRLSISTLLEMTSEELANDELKKTREEVHQRMTRDAQPHTQQGASTDQFKCGRCKQRKCTYYQMQTRSADEPLTTFVTCVNCENRWKF